MIEVERLLRWLRNDRFFEAPTRGEADAEYRRIWNAALAHVETSIIPRVVAEQRVDDCLTELCGEPD